MLNLYRFLMKTNKRLWLHELVAVIAEQLPSEYRWRFLMHYDGAMAAVAAYQHRINMSLTNQRDLEIRRELAREKR